MQQSVGAVQNCEDTGCSEAHIEVNPQQKGIAIICGLNEALIRVFRVVDSARDDDATQHEDHRVGNELQLRPVGKRYLSCLHYASTFKA